MMDVYQRKRVIFAYLVYKKYILKQRRRYWVHPFADLSLLRGRFYTSFADLRANSDKFFNYFRMSVQSFDELAEKSLDGRGSSQKRRSIFQGNFLFPQ
jgi:hypothetical protein